MDPLSALSISATVVQFLDFGSKILSKSAEIYNSSLGISLENQNLAAIGTSMLNLSKDLEKKEAELEWKVSAPLDPSEARSRRNRSEQWKKEQAIRESRQRELLSIVSACKSSSIELLNTIEKVKVQGPNSRWKSFRQALLAMYKSGEVDEMAARLEKYRSQLVVLLLGSIQYVAV